RRAHADGERLPARGTRPHAFGHAWTTVALVVELASFVNSIAIALAIALTVTDAGVFGRSPHDGRHAAGRSALLLRRRAGLDPHPAVRLGRDSRAGRGGPIRSGAGAGRPRRQDHRVRRVRRRTRPRDRAPLLRAAHGAVPGASADRRGRRAAD